MNRSRAVYNATIFGMPNRRSIERDEKQLNSRITLWSEIKKKITHAQTDLGQKGKDNRSNNGRRPSRRRRDIPKHGVTWVAKKSPSKWLRAVVHYPHRPKMYGWYVLAFVFLHCLKSHHFTPWSGCNMPSNFEIHVYDNVDYRKLNVCSNWHMTSS